MLSRDRVRLRRLPRGADGRESTLRAADTVHADGAGTGASKVGVRGALISTQLPLRHCLRRRSLREFLPVHPKRPT